MPIDWPEPFGLVMIEAMACGTPVIAFNRGSVPEVVDEGVTGFIVEDEEGAIGAVDRLSHLSRARIRKRFEERFTARRMALDYLAVYRSLMEPGRRACGSSPTKTSRDRGIDLSWSHEQVAALASRAGGFLWLILAGAARLGRARLRHQRPDRRKPTAAIAASPKNATELPK